MRDDELWRVPQLKRAFVGAHPSGRLRWMRGLTEPAQLLAAETLLDPEALTIGFARRFATYKRATLIFHDGSSVAHARRSLGVRADRLQGRRIPPTIRKHLIREVYEAGPRTKLGAHRVRRRR